MSSLPPSPIQPHDADQPPPLPELARLMLRYFLQGCLVVAPIVVTVYVVFLVIAALDTLVPVSMPLFVVILLCAGVTGTGAFASSVFGSAVLSEAERSMRKVPLLRLLYGSIKDLVNAVLGKHKSFQSPVMVALDPEKGIHVVGFLTREDVPFSSKHVAVYLPQSYNFAGNLILVERDRVTPIEADSADLMAFIVSGGVSTSQKDIG